MVLITVAKIANDVATIYTYSLLLSIAIYVHVQLVTADSLIRVQRCPCTG